MLEFYIEELYVLEGILEEVVQVIPGEILDDTQVILDKIHIELRDYEDEERKKKE